MHLKEKLLGMCFIGVVCTAVAMHASPQQPVDRQPAAAAKPGTEPDPSGPSEADTAHLAKPQPPPKQEKTAVTLENDKMEVVFTPKGGAIQEIRLKAFPQSQSNPTPYALDAQAKIPALAFHHIPGLDAYADYSLATWTADTVIFRKEIQPDVFVARSYTLVPASTSRNDPKDYVIHHATTFVNDSDTALVPRPFDLQLGAAFPEHDQNRSRSTNFSYYDDHKAHFIRPNTFLPHTGLGALLGRSSTPPAQKISEVHPVRWAAVKNQFFIQIATFSEPVQGFFALPAEGIDSDTATMGISGGVQLKLDTIEPHATQTFELDYYAGPKDYHFLENMPHAEEEAMQFGFFSFFSKWILDILDFLHRFIPSYGLSIIALTLIIRSSLLPLTLKSAISSQRMSQIQAPLKKLREQHKNDPARLQKATMALFKEHKVNPMGGCLPVLLQMPVFLSLLGALRSTADLRFASFLWVPDLSAPDTIATIVGIPVNPMPILMGLALGVQTWLSSSSMNNTQPGMKQIMAFMPLVVTFMLYNFNAGLTLYWTVSNLFTIGQSQIIKRYFPPHAANEAQRS